MVSGPFSLFFVDFVVAALVARCALLFCSPSSLNVQIRWEEEDEIEAAQTKCKSGKTTHLSVRRTPTQVVIAADTHQTHSKKHGL